MVRIQFHIFFLLSGLLFGCLSESHMQVLNNPFPFNDQRYKRGITRTDSNQQIFYTSLPNVYGSPDVEESANTQDVNFSILQKIHSELSQIENILGSLFNHFNSLQQNIATNTNIPKEYGPPTLSQKPQPTEKYITENYASIQSAVQNLKSVANHLESEVNKHSSHNHHSEKVPTIHTNQHYHVSTEEKLPEFLTLDPFVGYGPSPQFNFAPPAPGSLSSVQDVDMYSPPDGVLLAPPAPGKLPIRTRNNAI